MSDKTIEAEDCHRARGIGRVSARTAIPDKIRDELRRLNGEDDEKTVIADKAQIELDEGGAE